METYRTSILHPDELIAFGLYNRDVAFLRDRFMLKEDDETAAAHFKGQIKKSLTTLMTKINWTAHILAHR